MKKDLPATLRTRNAAFGLVLCVVVILFYGLALVRVGG